MSMGHREALRSEDEHDAVTGWRRVLRFRLGERKSIKRKLSRRARKDAKRALDVALAADAES
jgi:hypothetical protein